LFARYSLEEDSGLFRFMGGDFHDTDGVLRRGDESYHVANWQRFLFSQGFGTVEPDGDFGPVTERATRDFQRRYGLRADGVAGPATLDKAEDLLARHTAGTIASSGYVPEPQAGAAANQPRLSRVHPTLALRAMQVINAASAAGFVLVVTQGLRSFAEQDALFRQRPPVTRARGGQSMHNYGLAVDFAFKVDGQITWEDSLYGKIGLWARGAGLEWGGAWPRFRDRPHVQLPDLPSYKRLLPAYQSGGLPAVWEQFVKG
jgi:hypothetical protein